MGGVGDAVDVAPPSWAFSNCLGWPVKSCMPTAAWRYTARLTPTVRCKGWWATIG